MHPNLRKFAGVKSLLRAVFCSKEYSSSHAWQSGVYILRTQRGQVCGPNAYRNE